MTLAVGGSSSGRVSIRRAVSSAGESTSEELAREEERSIETVGTEARRAGRRCTSASGLDALLGATIGLLAALECRLPVLSRLPATLAPAASRKRTARWNTSASRRSRRSSRTTRTTSSLLCARRGGCARGLGGARMPIAVSSESTSDAGASARCTAV